MLTPEDTSLLREEVAEEVRQAVGMEREACVALMEAEAELWAIAARKLGLEPETRRRWEGYADQLNHMAWVIRARGEHGQGVDAGAAGEGQGS